MTEAVKEVYEIKEVLKTCISFFFLFCFCQETTQNCSTFQSFILDPTYSALFQKQENALPKEQSCLFLYKPCGFY